MSPSLTSLFGRLRLYMSPEGTALRYPDAAMADNSPSVVSISEKVMRFLTLILSSSPLYMFDRLSTALNPMLLTESRMMRGLPSHSQYGFME